MDSLSCGFISGSVFYYCFLLLFFITVFYCVHVIYVHVICAHAIDLTDGKCYFTYINLKDVLSEIILREFFSCIPVLYG